MRVGRVGRTVVSVTPTVWLFPAVFGILGLVLAAPGPGAGLADRVYHAAVFTLGVGIFTVVHGFGHVLGGTLAGGAMDELLFTATRGVNLYAGDQSSVPPRVHIARAAGGPVLNLACAAALYVLLPSVGGGFLRDLMATTASTSLIAGFGSFLPLPSIDGQVIWREVLRSLRS